MGITALSGPIFQYGITQSSSGGGVTGLDVEHNELRAPMFADLGDAMMDPRAAFNYDPGSGVTVKTVGLYNNAGTVDYVPLTASTSATPALFGSSNTSSGVAGNFTLTASSANGTFATTIVAPETGQNVSVIAIESTAALLTFGSAGTAAVWNPGFGTGRTLAITTSSSGDLGGFTIAGRDVYGFKMTETIAVTQATTNSSGLTYTSQKAYKFVAAISNASTPVSTSVLIGFTDTFGFPLAVPYAGFNAQVQLLASKFSSAVVVAMSSASMVAASTAATQTSSTPDVRGTYKSSTASNGTLRLQMVITPSASAIAAITSTNVAPLFGGTQFSSV